jgi:hypothetical protein
MAWAPDYLTPDELEIYVRVTDDLDEDQHTLAIAAASRAIDSHTNRQFGVVAAAEERTYDVVWDRHIGRWIVVVDDLMDATGLVVELENGTTYTVGDGFSLHPRNAYQKGRPWTEIQMPSFTWVSSRSPGEVTVTGLWGWTAVPEPVKLATAMQANRFNARRDSPFGVTGSPEQGGELRLLAKVDPDVAVILRPFVRTVN